MGDGTGRRRRARMPATQRREQLLGVGLRLFAERGFAAASMEEVAVRAEVSKPVVYEHFGDKERLYQAVVEREVGRLLERLTAALTAGHPRRLLEQATLALLCYIELDTDGFRVLMRDSPMMSGDGRFPGLLNEVAQRVEHHMAAGFAARGYDRELAGLYAQALTGLVAFTGRWWLDVRQPPREVVAAHLVNLVWNGLSDLERAPEPASGAGPATC
ncbi:MAG: TetR/AcrR family transcriptional regulator [Actinocatenispora sp.]